MINTLDEMRNIQELKSKITLKLSTELLNCYDSGYLEDLENYFYNLSIRIRKVKDFVKLQELEEKEEDKINEYNINIRDMHK